MRPTSVLDASALLALLYDAPGAEATVEAIIAGTTVSVFNWAEVLSKVAANGEDPGLVAERLDTGAQQEPVIWIGVPALTSDGDWVRADVDIEIRLIR